MTTTTTVRDHWRRAGWRIEHTGGGCEALVRYYRRGADTLAVVLTADLAVPDGPTDPFIDPPGVYLESADRDPDEHETSWGDELHVEWRRSEDTYDGWRRLADTLALLHGADPVDLLTDPSPYRGAGAAYDEPGAIW